MLPKRRLFVLLIFFAALSAVESRASGLPDATDITWMRVASDDGAFSVEIPQKHTYFFNKDGFILGDGISTYLLSNMSLASSYVDGTLISFEVYDGPGDAMDIIVDSDAKRDSVRSKSEIKRPGYKIKQIISKSDTFYAVRQYVAIKSRIYILTAATSGSESETMKHFLDSVQFVAGKNPGTLSNGTTFSKLKRTEPELELSPDMDKPLGKPPTAPVQPIIDPDVRGIRIVTKPISSYVEPARRNNVQGTIRLQITMSENGSIPKIKVIKTLPDGLLRQSIFAALRIKFLPKEIKGKPVSVVVIFDYGFGIY